MTIDGVTWARIATFALALSAAGAVGLAASTPIDAVRAEFTEAEVLLEGSQPDVEVTQLVGPDGGTISVDFGGSPRHVFFPAGALLREVLVTVKLSATPNTTYPDDAECLRIYKPEKLRYISQLLTVELPLDALDWLNEDSLMWLLYLSPGFTKGAYDENLFIASEVRFRRADGSEYMSSNHYGLDYFVEVAVNELRDSYYWDRPSTLAISIQIVDETAVFEDSPSSASFDGKLNSPSGSPPQTN